MQTLNSRALKCTVVLAPAERIGFSATLAAFYRTAG